MRQGSESRTLNPQTIGTINVNRYLSDRDMADLAERRYRDTGEGLTSEYVLHAKYASSKKKAQDKLKYYRKKNVLFTLGRTKPQQYFPTSLQSEIVKSRQSTPIEHMGMEGDLIPPVAFGRGIQGHDMDKQKLDSLVGSIYYMLPRLPFFIHKMNFRTSVSPELYVELDLQALKKNKMAKRWESRIGSFLVNYRLYPNGTLMIYTKTSDRPFRLQTESDLYELMAFVGEIRRCITLRLQDLQGRSVQPITKWYISQCDINKDVPVDHALHSIGLNARIPYLEKLFHIYIKSMGPNTVARIEQELSPNELFLQFLDRWLDPEWVEKYRQETGDAVMGLLSGQQQQQQ